MADLRSTGYTPLRPLLIEAASVGAPHPRERIFVVAHLDDCGRLHGQAEEHATKRRKPAQLVAGPGGAAFSNGDGPESQGRSFGFGEVLDRGSAWWGVEPDVGRVADGVSNRVDRIKCLGNSVVPQVAQVIAEHVLALAE